MTRQRSDFLLPSAPDSVAQLTVPPYLMGIRLLWIAALFGSFLLCVFAAFRGGYVGPDYFTHLMRFVDWAKIFDFSGIRITLNPSRLCSSSLVFLMAWRVDEFLWTNIIDM